MTTVNLTDRTPSDRHLAAPAHPLLPLRAVLAGALVLPGEAAWDEARAAWNLAVDQRPVAVVLPRTAQDIVHAVRACAAAGLRVAMQSTGHNAAPLDLAGAVLVRTSAMRGVTVDPGTGTVRAEAGALWSDVVPAVAAHGRVVLAGSAADVGVVGYTLGGGLSWLGRRFGLAANDVVAAEVVTADGVLRRVDADTDPELFWALRGGGGSFAAVVALHLRTHTAPALVAGALFFPIERAREVFLTWRDGLSRFSDDTSSCARLLRVPDLPGVPEPLRGKAFALVEVAHCGTPHALDQALTVLRALGPVLDTVAPCPAEGLQRLHLDPDGPVPGVGGGTMVSALPDGVLDALLACAGPGVDTPLLSLELRHLGGALARIAPDAGALRRLEGQYALFAVGMAPTPEAARAVERAVDTALDAPGPWRSRDYANFAERRTCASRFHDEATLARLWAAKDAYDPSDLFAANHPVV